MSAKVASVTSPMSRINSESGRTNGYHSHPLNRPTSQPVTGARMLEHIDKMTADVAEMSRDEYFHDARNSVPQHRRRCDANTHMD